MRTYFTGITTYKGKISPVNKVSKKTIRLLPPKVDFLNDDHFKKIKIKRLFLTY